LNNLLAMGSSLVERALMTDLVLRCKRGPPGNSPYGRET
jgi:hypothetical protein